VLVMTPTGVVARSDWPRRPEHREPHHAAHVGGEGMTGSLTACPHQPDTRPW